MTSLRTRKVRPPILRALYGLWVPRIIRIVLIMSLALIGWAGPLFDAAAAKQAKQKASSKPVVGDQPAKQAFGAIKVSLAKQQTHAIGTYNLGCISGAKQLPETGPLWQAMRLSRNRTWGHPSLVAYIEKLAKDVKKLDGWPGLLVGDMGQPLGGPMVSGHASHQIGLDVDLWYKPMPDHVLSSKEREEISADSMIDAAAFITNPKFWGETQITLIRRAALSPEVARVFVHPLIKKSLCDAKSQDRGWLAKVRPWWGHDDHFHVRLKCPAADKECVSQPETSSDEGCGAELTDWLKKLKAVKPAPPATPSPPKKPLMVSQMPKACQDLLHESEKTQAAQ